MESLKLRYRQKGNPNYQLVFKYKRNIPASEPDPIPDSSSSDSSFPEAGFFSDESSTKADYIPDKLGKIKLTIIVNHQFIKAMIKELLKLWC